MINSFFNDEINVMITNPEMLLHLIETGKLKRAVGNISLFVIDEAHTAITWGESFRPSFLKLKEIIEYIKPQHIAAYTATMDSRIESSIKKLIFNNEELYTIHASANRENIFYNSIKSYSKLSDVANILKNPNNRPAIIFCASREKTEKIKDELSSHFNIKSYHAGMKKEDRQEIESWFMETNTGILSATIAFGMGVDKKNIRTVIHLGIPNEAYDFLQESGRAGRDGKPSKSYVVYYPDDNGKLNDIFKGKDCIRTGLLKHMNENPEETMCISCSSCVGSEYVQAGLLEILKTLKRRKILSFKKINSLITRKSIWNRYYIPLWRYENTKIALSDLLFNGYIKRIFNSYYALKANGRKLLKEKRRR